MEQMLANIVDTVLPYLKDPVSCKNLALNIACFFSFSVYKIKGIIVWTIWNVYHFCLSVIQLISLFPEELGFVIKFFFLISLF